MTHLPSQEQTERTAFDRREYKLASGVTLALSHLRRKCDYNRTCKDVAAYVTPIHLAFIVATHSLGYRKCILPQAACKKKIPHF